MSVGLIAVAGGAWWANSQPAPIPEHLLTTGGDFTLQSADGPVALQDYRGKVVLLYFGYTNCPDACPMTMANWARAFKQLKKNELARVTGMLVSVDPQRDSPDMLKKYTRYFHPNIIGLTGSAEALEKALMLYRSDYEIDGGEDGENYEVAHMSFVYVIDPQGKVRELLTHESSPDAIVAGIRNALRVGG